MIDEKLDERIQKFAQSTRLNDAGRRAGFEGYQPTQSMADRQGEAPSVAQNVPPPPPRPAPPPIQTRADTNLPQFSKGSVSRDAGGLHTGRYVTQKDFEEGNAQVEAYKRAHPERTGYRQNVTSNRYRGDSWDRPSQTFAPSATTPRQGAAQFRQAAQQPAQSPAAQGGGTDLAATNARAKVLRQQAADQEAQGREKMDGLMGQALTTLLGEWRQNGVKRVMDDPMNGKQMSLFRVAWLEPATLRQINEQRQSFGLRDTDKVIGMMAVGDAGADGKTGTPSFYLRYRDANGRVHSRVATYEQAARQYAMAHMKANGSTDAAYDLANNETWNDPLRYKNTGAYLDTQAKIDTARMQNEAASLKNDLMRQQMEQGKTEFEQKQADRAEKKENEQVAKAQASAKEYRDFAAKVAKDNPELASQMLQVAAKFESDANREQGKINRRKEIDGLKKGDPIPSIPGARKKNDTGYDIEPMEGYEEKNGRFVRVKPQKPGAKPPTAQNTSSATTETGGEANAQETQTVSGEGANESMPQAVNTGNEQNGSVGEPQNGNTPGNIAQQAKGLDIMGRLGRAIRSLGEGYQTGEAGSEPVMRYDIRSERNVQKRQDEQNYNKRVSSARLRRARQDAEDRARIERDNESHDRLMQSLSKSQKEREAEWKERSRKIAAIKDAEARKRLKKQADEEKKKMMELYSSGDIDAIRREEQKAEELDALLEDVTK